MALGRSCLAISAGDATTQLTCKPINATVLSTLAFVNDMKFSLLPLVDYRRTQAGKPGIGQLASPNFIIQGDSLYYEHYYLGQTFIFQINLKFILFSVIVFADIHQAVSETHNGLTDLRSLLATIAHTVVDKDRLQQAIFSLQASEAYDANFFVVTNSVRHFARTTFLLAPEFATEFF